MNNIMFLRLPQVIEKTGLSRSAIYRKGKEGTFPSQIKIGARTVVWNNYEIDQWCEAQIKCQ